MTRSQYEQLLDILSQQQQQIEALQSQIHRLQSGPPVAAHGAYAAQLSWLGAKSAQSAGATA